MSLSCGQRHVPCRSNGAGGKLGAGAGGSVFSRRKAKLGVPQAVGTPWSLSRPGSCTFGRQGVLLDRSSQEWGGDFGLNYLNLQPGSLINVGYVGVHQSSRSAGLWPEDPSGLPSPPSLACTPSGVERVLHVGQRRGGAGRAQPAPCIAPTALPMSSGPGQCREAGRV